MTEELPPTPFELPDNEGQEIYRLELPAGAHLMLFKGGSEVEWEQALRPVTVYCNGAGVIFAYVEATK